MCSIDIAQIPPVVSPYMEDVMEKILNTCWWPLV